MPTVIATPGASNANSYLTRDNATAYFGTRLNSTVWTAASDANKDIALIQATRTLDAGFDWRGTSTYADQELAFPRTGLTRRTGYAVDSTTIPSEIEAATAELAMALLRSDRTLESAAGAAGLTDLKVGPIQLKFKDDLSALIIPEAIAAFVPRDWYCVVDPDEIVAHLEIL